MSILSHTTMGAGGVVTWGHVERDSNFAKERSHREWSPVPTVVTVPIPYEYQRLVSGIYFINFSRSSDDRMVTGAMVSTIVVSTIYKSGKLGQVMDTG